MSAADERGFKSEIEITKDLTLPKLFVSSGKKVWRRKSRHEGEGVWCMAPCHMESIP